MMLYCPQCPDVTGVSLVSLCQQIRDSNIGERKQKLEINCVVLRNKLRDCSESIVPQ